MGDLVYATCALSIHKLKKGEKIMENREHPLITAIYVAVIALVFAVLTSQAIRGCQPAEEDAQKDIREEHHRMSARAIRDAGAPDPDRFTGRLYVRPGFEYSDHAPDAADDLDLRRDAGTPRPVDKSL